MSPTKFNRDRVCQDPKCPECCVMDALASICANGVIPNPWEWKVAHEKMHQERKKPNSERPIAP